MNEASFPQNPSRINAVVTRVTPTLARELLARNDRNRPLNRVKVTRYKEAMLDRRWLDTFEPIHVGNNGQLLNGQHRLTAVIEADATVEMLIIYNVDPAVIVAIDTGRPRSFADVLTVHGGKNTTHLGSIVGLSWAVDNGRPGVNMGALPPHDIALRIYESDRDAFDVASSLSANGLRRHFITPKLAGWLCYVTELRAVEWLQDVIQGRMLRPKTGAFALHRRMMIEAERHARPHIDIAFICLVKAYLADCTGKTVGSLKVVDNETLPTLSTLHFPKYGRNRLKPVTPARPANDTATRKSA